MSPDASPGLAHPYQPLFSSAGDLYVSCQNTNVVVALHGPEQPPPAGKPTRLSKFLLSLQEKNSKATFDPGTFVPAWSTKGGAPTTPVPVEEGGLTFKTLSAGDVLAGLDVEDAADAKSHKPATSTPSAGSLSTPPASSMSRTRAADRVTVFNTGVQAPRRDRTQNSTPLSSPVALFFAPDDGGSGKLYIGGPGNQSLLVYDVAKGDFQGERVPS